TTKSGTPSPLKSPVARATTETFAFVGMDAMKLGSVRVSRASTVGRNVSGRGGTFFDRRDARDPNTPRAHSRRQEEIMNNLLFVGHSLEKSEGLPLLLQVDLDHLDQGGPAQRTTHRRELHSCVPPIPSRSKILPTGDSRRTGRTVI